MIKKSPNIIYMPQVLCRQIIRNASDYLGSWIVKKYLFTSAIIRQFKDADLTRILEIFEQSFGNKNSYQLVKYSKQFSNTLYIYEVNGTIVGYAGFYVHLKYMGLKKAYVATLYSIAIATSYRGKGYGSQLLIESIRELQNNHVSSIILYVNIKNNEAISLYQKNNFVIVDKIKDICGAENDCYHMRLDMIF